MSSASRSGSNRSPGSSGGGISSRAGQEQAEGSEGGSGKPSRDVSTRHSWRTGSPIVPEPRSPSSAKSGSTRKTTRFPLAPPTPTGYPGSADRHPSSLSGTNESEDGRDDIQTKLLVAAKSRKPSDVLAYLEKGANPLAPALQLRRTFLHRLCLNPWLYPNLLVKIFASIGGACAQTLLSQQDKRGETPLYMALGTDFVDGAAAIIKTLIDNGADPMALLPSEQLPLHRAAWKGSVAVTQVILDHMDLAAIDTKDDLECTPLDTACWKGHHEIAEILIKAGANIHTRDNDDWTPLRSAAQHGQLRVCEILIENGADIHARDNKGMTSLRVAAEHGKTDIIALLYGLGADLASHDELGFTGLHAASRDGELEAVRQLLVFGAYVNCRTLKGYTPLDLACWNGEDVVVKTLIEAGAAVNVCDWRAMTPLMTACEANKLSIVNLLLEHGADVHRQDTAGQAAIDRLTDLPDNGILQVLVDKGAYSDVASSFRGATPLMAAVRFGILNAVASLLKRGADTNKRDKGGFHCLMHACQIGRPQVVEVLLNHKEKPVDVDQRDNSGNSSLIYATSYGHEAVIEMLVKVGKADVNISNVNNTTALLSAATFGLASIARFLLSAGADLTIRDKSGRNALHRAAMGESVENSFSTEQLDPMQHLRAWNEVVVDLLDKGADPLVQDDLGHTALHLVAFSNDLERTNSILDKVPSDKLTIRNKEKFTPLGTACVRQNRFPAEAILARVDVADFGDNHEETEKNALWWAANGGETHEIVRLLFKKSATLTVPMLSETMMGWTAMDWAAYRGMPNVLWGLLCTTEQGDNSDKMRMSAMKLAKERRKQEEKLKAAALPRKLTTIDVVGQPLHMKTKDKDSSAKYRGGKYGAPAVKEVKEIKELKLDEAEISSRPATPVTGHVSPVDNVPKDNWPAEHAGLEASKRPVEGDTVKRPNEKKYLAKKEEEAADAGDQQGISDVYGLIIDMLRDPPVTQTSGPKEPFVAPSFEQKSSGILDEYEAAVVDFYATGGRSGFLRRYRSIKETIYTSSPLEIMRKARETMHQVGSGIRHADSIGGLDQHKLYSFDELRFTWIHLPANNLKWMQDLILKLYVEDETYSETQYRDMSAFLRKSWLQTPDRTSKTRFMKPRCVQDGDSYPLALYVPYLTFSQEATDRRRLSASDDYIKNLEKYTKLLEEYSDSIIHGSRTLDEFYYHFASDERFQKDMQLRNLDQVVTKAIDGSPMGMADAMHLFTAVRVDQLWLWMLDDYTLVTSSTHRMDGMPDPIFSGVLDLLGQGDSRSRVSQPTTALEMSQTIVDFCVGQFNRGSPSTRSHGSLRQIFFDSINKTAIEESELYRKLLSKMESARLRSQKRQNAIGRAAGLFREIKDIRDELNILKAVVEAQEIVQNQLQKIQPRDIQSAKSILKDIYEMDELAKRIQSSINTTLTLEQNEIAISQAQQSVRQGRTLMVFTVVTILFLPMSFLTSFFAIDVAAFVTTPKWTFAVIFAVSVGITMPLACYAFYSDDIVGFFHDLTSKPSSASDQQSTGTRTESVHAEILSLRHDGPEKRMTPNMFQDERKESIRARMKEMATVGPTSNNASTRWKLTRRNGSRGMTDEEAQK
ncbi:Serine/threonine-protein phosphatase 6 regulatory ankyrin repeat subunit C-like protein [Emericellopsis cladophorae]|uniref:Serine/threonine-protein phosphatase 6 regulatory ankyrin repeat subunit C-like protein n=1 Tax=Emericellopsis cladophorae TaxID=2686198 RepID=A0A9P9Y6W4_9HYPO|nr:Serine/threonine-protein phosphatase 6 regulatory ankyrin repeat subunit C-like protein [Emericellopsis cladophorae]KAI6784034.1 Serine/threonine-protein phosphatase 6 regulatory ankyrin repeat subunit C-like protein [Emericellopsis cladophorae]